MTKSVIGGALCGFGILIVIRCALKGIPDTTNVRRKLENRLGAKRAQDRAVLRLSEEEFAASILATGVAGLILGGILVGFLSYSQRIIPAVLLLLLTVLAPAGAIAIRLEQIEKAAERARQAFVYALSSYLDLASVLLAGGSGTETALVAAARTGDSWAFHMIRDAIEMARVERRPLWVALGDLGRKLGVGDLERVAGSMQLAGEQGARVRESLATQAEALRARQIAEIEANAQAATERMGLPTVLLFVGFITLLGYPALHLVIGQM